MHSSMTILQTIQLNLFERHLNAKEKQAIFFSVRSLFFFTMIYLRGILALVLSTISFIPNYTDLHFTFFLFSRCISRILWPCLYNHGSTHFDANK